MQLYSILGACAGALAGAVLWAGITYTTGYEIGWIAWGVGAAVGMAASKLGGEGMSMGIVCAILALVAILAGKYFTILLSLDHEMKELISNATSDAAYQNALAEAEAYAQLDAQDPAAVTAFMVKYEYTDEKAENVSPETINEFKKENEPQLLAMHSAPPPYETWSVEQESTIRAFVAASIPMTEVYKEQFGAMDLLFGFLGISTAFRLGSSGFKREAAAG